MHIHSTRYKQCIHGGSHKLKLLKDIHINNLLVCPGFQVKSSTLSENSVCLCVAVECRRMQMNREGAGEGRGGRERDLGKSVDYLLIFVSEWMSGDW